MEKKECADNSKNPNFLHWAGIALVLVGWYAIMQLKIFEGLETVFLGCGFGLLGCEFEDHRG